MTIRWIIADIDGCLSPDKSVPWDVALFFEFAQLCRTAASGAGPIPPITLCTGRPQPYVEVLLKLLHIHAPAICENGAVLYSLDDNWARFGPGVTEEKILGLRDVRAFLETEVLPNYADTLIQFGKEAQISVFSERPALFPEIKARIEEHVARNGGADLVITASPCYLNISLAGVDKGSTLRALLDELGVQHDEVAGIGDSEGDLPLRDAVGFFACPANADDEIKAAADYVSPHEDLAGVLDILQHPAIRHKAS